MWDFLELMLGAIIDVGGHRSWKRLFVTLGIMLLVFVGLIVLIYLLIR